jgi:uncharacterized protein (DUF2344 family)
MSDLTLFDLGAKYLDVLGKIEEAQGELSPELEAELNAAINEILAKTDGYIQVASEFNVAIQQAKEWEQKFQAKRKSLENQLDRLKARLLEHMQKTNTPEIVGQLGKVKLMHSKVVTILNEKEIPANFIETVTTTKVLKSEISAALKLGKDVPGAKLETTDYIRIF